MLDFNDADSQRSTDLIPDGTLVTVHMTVRPGNAGQDGWLKRSKSGESEALDCEFVVLEGPYAKRKFWTLMTMNGTTEGQQKAAEISRARLRAILEAVRGIKPSDESPQATEARRISSLGDFDGMRFMCKVRIEKGGEGYKDRNAIGDVITPDRQAWQRTEQLPRQASLPNAAVAAQANAAQAAQGKPSWAS